MSSAVQQPSQGRSGQDDAELRAEVVALGASFFNRGLTAGRTGNLSVRVQNGFLVTPTGASLGNLTQSDLSLVDLQVRHIDGPRPSKEAFLHAAVYRARPQDSAVVHTHSTHAVAVSCLADVDPHDVLPPLTAYYVMRVGRLPLVPYHAPGDQTLGELAEHTARTSHAMLLANHGPVISGADLASAADAVEELEETARLHLMLYERRTRPLTREQMVALRLT